MLGVLVNAAAIIVGSIIGVVFKNAVSERLARSIQVALGTITMVVGFKMALRCENILLIVGCIAGGGVLGTIWEVEKRIEGLGEWVKNRVARKGDGQFAIGFSVTSILYCVGAMAVVGSINSGVSGDHEILYTKATLDGVISITFAAVYGIGVAFSSLSVLVYQGAIALLAPQVHALTSAAAISAISGVGGIMVLMIGLNVAGIKKIPVGDYFPAVLLALLAAPFLR